MEKDAFEKWFHGVVHWQATLDSKYMEWLVAASPGAATAQLADGVVGVLPLWQLSADHIAGSKAKLQVLKRPTESAQARLPCSLAICACPLPFCMCPWEEPRHEKRKLKLATLRPKSGGRSAVAGVLKDLRSMDLPLTAREMTVLAVCVLRLRRRGVDCDVSAVIMQVDQSVERSNFRVQPVSPCTCPGAKYLASCSGGPGSAWRVLTPAKHLRFQGLLLVGWSSGGWTG